MLVILVVLVMLVTTNHSPARLPKRSFESFVTSGHLFRWFPKELSFLGVLYARWLSTILSTKNTSISPERTPISPKSTPDKFSRLVWFLYETSKSFTRLLTKKISLLPSVKRHVLIKLTWVLALTTARRTINEFLKRIPLKWAISMNWVVYLHITANVTP